MEQHPVPQEISSYQFRLVGNMTLKQFFQLAGGALVSLLFYATSLPPLIKWPFIVVFALAGAAVAFLPFEDRPLEKWVVAFFRSVYSPTVFLWQKGVQTAYFQAEGTATREAPGQISAPIQAGFLSNLEEAEKAFLSRVTALFGTATAPVTTAPVKLPETTLEGVEKLQGAIPIVQETPRPQALQPKKQIGIPEAPIIAPQGYKPRVVVEEGPQAPAAAPTPQSQTSQVQETLTGQALGQGQAVQFSQEAAPPIPPTQPNIIVGQVMDAQGKIIEGAILEVKDAAGRPARAVKTNKAGHFLIVTPLADGRYEILTEKEGYAFEPATFAAENKIIPPIAIRSKN